MRTLWALSVILVATMYWMLGGVLSTMHPLSGSAPVDENRFSTESTNPLSGSKIAFVSNGTLYVMNADGSERLALTDKRMPMAVYHPTWSPDGKQIAIEV